MVNERAQLIKPKAEDARDVGRGAITEANPDHLRRGTQQNTETLKVLIFRDEDETISLRAIPNRTIRRACEPKSDDIHGPGKGISEKPRQPASEILVKEQFHRGEPRRSEARNAREPPLTVGSKAQAGQDVLVRELRKLGEELRFRHAASEVGKDVADGDACASHCGLAESNIRINDNAFAIVRGLGHAWSLDSGAKRSKNAGRPGSYFCRGGVASGRMRSYSTCANRGSRTGCNAYCCPTPKFTCGRVKQNASEASFLESPVWCNARSAAIRVSPSEQAEVGAVIA